LRITQHVPCFVECDPYRGTFDTLKELFEIDWIKQYQKDDNLEFYRFSLSSNILMAEYNKGNKWWVVGYIYGDLCKIDLPIWKAK